jgi:hypothetical protein
LPPIPGLALLGLALLGPVLASATVSAQGAPAPKTAPEAASSTAAPAPKGEWTASDYKAVRDRDEARQRDWDRKMKAVAGSICTGC